MDLFLVSVLAFSSSEHGWTSDTIRPCRLLYTDQDGRSAVMVDGSVIVVSDDDLYHTEGAAEAEVERRVKRIAEAAESWIRRKELHK